MLHVGLPALFRHEAERLRQRRRSCNGVRVRHAAHFHGGLHSLLDSSHSLLGHDQPQKCVRSPSATADDYNMNQIRQRGKPNTPAARAAQRTGSSGDPSRLIMLSIAMGGESSTSAARPDADRPRFITA